MAYIHPDYDIEPDLPEDFCQYLSLLLLRRTPADVFTDEVWDEINAARRAKEGGDKKLPGGCPKCRGDYAFQFATADSQWFKCLVQGCRFEFEVRVPA